MKRTIALAGLALASWASADIYFGGQEYDKAYVGGQEFTGVEVAGQSHLSGESSYTLTLTLDRTFTDTPAAGPNIGAHPTFVHDGKTWEVWQVIPFLGPAIGGTTLGDLRFQTRIMGEAASTLALTDMPATITVANDRWTGSPWTFTRPTAAAKFGTSGSSDAVRRRAEYEPSGRTPSGTPAQSGVVQQISTVNQTFTATFTF